MPPGRHASRNKATPPMAAGLALEAMRRRARLTRIAVWSVIAAGPIALGVAVTSTPTTAGAAPLPKPSTVRTTAVAADPAGYAQLFVGAWLRSNADDAANAQTRLAQSLAPDVELPDPATNAHPAPESVTAVRSAQRADGGWSVTVAAQYADGAVRYYTVPVATDRAGTIFTVTGAPGVVAGPARAEAPPAPYAVTVPDGELAATVGEFLSAYLTDAGEVDRYLAPGVHLTAVSPAPYQAVTVQQVLAVEEAAAAERMPGDGTKVRVLAQVEARDAQGRWPLGYELTLTARSGRWDIAELQTGTSRGGGERS
ncbi:conjugal transfer protein [Streptomyces sp. NBC_00287]|uniref:conjugal transfer protein n=1 Tax=Streptomyces sp. NBC_00287 TaxID=2975702 RepID=UPI002E2CCAE3|nr:conjugal transfer protein [Streptomyces sp. NBC_00287]